MTTQFAFRCIFGKIVSSNLDISIFLPTFAPNLVTDAFAIPLWVEMG